MIRSVFSAAVLSLWAGASYALSSVTLLSVKPVMAKKLIWLRGSAQIEPQEDFETAASSPRRLQQQLTFRA
jgi:hypothetical protein